MHISSVNMNFVIFFKICSPSRTSDFYAEKAINIVVNEFAFPQKGAPDNVLKVLAKFYINTPKSDYGGTPQKMNLPYNIIDLTGVANGRVINAKFFSSSSDVQDAILSSPSTTDSGVSARTKRGLPSSGSHGPRKVARNQKYE